MSNTTSFELSKQLFEVAKAKGYKLPSSKHFHTLSHYNLHTNQWDPEIRRYTTDELLGWLPASIKTNKYVYFLMMEKILYGFRFGYFDLSDNETAWIVKQQDTEPQKALCKLAIYLLENDLMPKNK